MLRLCSHRHGWWLLLSLLAGACLPAAAQPAEQIIIKTFPQVWSGRKNGAGPTDPVVKVMQAHPEILVEEWSSLEIPGAGFRTPLMLSIAGDTAPDLYYSWFHIMRKDISQGFIAPLNEWIGEDLDDNGQIDIREARWPEWAHIDPIVRRVATVRDPVTRQARVYGIPMSNTWYLTIFFRADLVRQEGLDPNTPPKTWDEFFYWCQRLTDPTKKRVAMTLPCYGFTWLSWLYAAGGTPVEQVVIHPQTGREVVFPMEETRFIDPETGDDLSRERIVPRAALGSQAAIDSLAFYHKLRWQPWLRDRRTGEPINLTPAQVARGQVTLPDGRTIRFSKDDVITGVVIPHGGQTNATDWGQLMARGEVVMTQAYLGDMIGFIKANGFNANLLGAMPVPAMRPGGKRVLQVQRHYAVMSEGVQRRPKRERDAVWHVLTAITSPAAYDEGIHQQVLTGQARWVNPDDLIRLGYADYVKEVPPSLRELYADKKAGKLLIHGEPFEGYWVAMDGAINTEVTSIVLSSGGEHFDYATALRNVQRAANEGIMFDWPERKIAEQRPAALLIFLVVVTIVGLFLVLIIRNQLAARTMESRTARGVHRAWLPWLLLFPALALIAIWGYYPLVRGAVMGFQDYHIVGKSPFVGLDNFIKIFLDPDFFIYVKQTVKFVIFNLALVFCAPIVLALFLSEIPWGKVFWRSVFFLPQLTSGLVVTLLWKLMYNPTDNGLLNQIIHLFGASRSIDWLGDPKYAMLAVIIPSVWASMGIGSLIYLAALKGIPDELYEAAALDGADVLAKLRFVTIPQLAPLIIINFVSAFIGTFQGMGNIFLLTFGGPGKETMVLGMRIWIEAYANLRFSIATSMAWILGGALIGFAYLQLRILRRVEFRRVEEV